jgi:hypothetical protein
MRSALSHKARSKSGAKVGKSRGKGGVLVSFAGFSAKEGKRRSLRLARFVGVVCVPVGGDELILPVEEERG